MHRHAPFTRPAVKSFRGSGQVELTGGAQDNGRVYVVNFTADDDQDGSCSGSVTVGVPHNRKDTPVDDGQNYKSSLP